MDYDHSDYARFLPAEVRERATVAPEATWWEWKGRRVHVARARNPASPVRGIVVHGGGGYSHALWPAASLAAARGYDIAAPDLPLYGHTVEPDPGSVTYADWIDLLVDFVIAEDDGRPLILFGASIGGMLAYEVAARTGRVATVVATCLLDPSDPEARRAAARFSFLGGPAPTLLRASAKVMPRLRLPIALMADLQNMSRDPELSKLCAADPRGGGGRVPVGWLADFFGFRHARPEDFSDTPVVLVHPAEDAWTPPYLSLRFLARIAAPTRVEMLENCGHYPIEQPGIEHLERVLEQVSADVQEI